MVKLKVEEAHGDYDYGTSKFLGAPTMPEEWLSDGTLSDDDFFFCQIKSKISPLTIEIILAVSPEIADKIVS